MRLAGSRPWCTIRQDPLVLVAHGSEERAGPSSSRDFFGADNRTYAPRAANTGEANNSLYTQERGTHGRTV